MAALQLNAKSSSFASPRLALLQKAKNGKKPLYDNMFQKIVWAIEDMVKTHETTLADNKAKREQCNTEQADANTVAARKKAAIEALTRTISELDADVQSTKNANTKMDGERTDLKNEITSGQNTWTKSDASREKEIGQLQETVRLINGAVEALSSSGSDRMGDVISILDMLKNEAITSTDALGKARSEEAKAWTEKKTLMADAVISLSDDIKAGESKITSLEKKKGEAQSKKSKVAAQEPMNTDQCQNFLLSYQQEQDGLNQKIQDLTSAKGHLGGWKNQSSDAQHFDGAATAYVPKE
jgi:chromosome segregation ATPase